MQATTHWYTPCCFHLATGDLSIPVCRELPLFCSCIKNININLFNQLPTDRHFGCFRLCVIIMLQQVILNVSFIAGFWVLHSGPWHARWLWGSFHHFALLAPHLEFGGFQAWRSDAPAASRCVPASLGEGACCGWMPVHTWHLHLQRETALLILYRSWHSSVDPVCGLWTLGHHLGEKAATLACRCGHQQTAGCCSSRTREQPPCPGVRCPRCLFTPVGGFT